MGGRAGIERKSPPLKQPNSAVLPHPNRVTISPRAVKPKVPSAGSWWLGLNREDFAKAQAQRQHELVNGEAVQTTIKHD